MLKIDKTKLKKGDIILSTSTHLQSKAIKYFTRSDISHAMIYVANSSVMDSTLEGVQARNIDKMFYDDSCAIYAYRLKEEIPQDRMQNIINYVRGENGAPYTLSGALSAVILPNVKGNGKQYCSRLISRAYAMEGIMFTKNADACTPAQIQKSSLVHLIENATLPVTTEDIEALERQGDTTIVFRAITSKLMVELRKIDPTIRVVNDINNALIKSPELDLRFSSALHTSGYLDFWKTDPTRFPWRYSPEKMIALYKNSNTETKPRILSYCNETLQHDADGDFKHWSTHMHTYQELEINTNLKTFSLLKTLYINLSNGHQNRINSAVALINLYSKKNYE